MKHLIKGNEGLIAVLALFILIAGGYFIDTSLGNVIVLILIMIAGVLYDSNKPSK